LGRSPLENFARPGSLSIRIGLFRGEPGDEVVGHHVLQSIALHGWEKMKDKWEEIWLIVFVSICTSVEPLTPVVDQKRELKPSKMAVPLPHLRQCLGPELHSTSVT
jgi:hypothetical protein